MNSTRNYTLITGASTGIGYELAKLFAKDRHNLILVARDEGKLETAKNELSKCNVEVKILSLDLSKSEDISRTVFTGFCNQLSVWYNFSSVYIFVWDIFSFSRIWFILVSIESLLSFIPA